jgi:hypothetical protein
MWHCFKFDMCFTHVGASDKFVKDVKGREIFYVITREIFLYDFVITIKLIVSDLYNMYVDLQKKYDDP